MNLKEALTAPDITETVSRSKPVIPQFGTPGTRSWDGEEGWINTQPTTEDITQYDEFLKDAFPGIDPSELEVIEPVQVRGWDSIKREYNAEIEDFESSVIRMHYYRLNVRKRRSGPSIDDLLSVVKKKRPVSHKVSKDAAGTYVIAIGDLQLGKMDGDGVEGTLDRVYQAIDDSAALYKLRRRIHPLAAVHCAFLGDCIEGFVSQGGNNAWRTPLPLTEQVALLRRIMLYSVEKFSPLSEKVSFAAIPGNHDQAVKFGKNGTTRYDDSWDVDSLRAVKDATALNKDAFGHVQFGWPAPDELTLTMNTSGTLIGHAHGHQFRGGWSKWWAGQSFGDQQIGQADILLSGHFHHLEVHQVGKRTFIQVPALESESTYYRHQQGVVGNPGVVNFITKDGAFNGFEVV